MGKNNKAIAKYYNEHPDLLEGFLNEIDNRADVLTSKTPNRILIQVEGGLVQSIHADNPDDVAITLIDWDNVQANNEPDRYGYEYENNWHAGTLTSDHIRELVQKANDIIRKNVGDDVEQRR